MKKLMIAAAVAAMTAGAFADTEKCSEGCVYGYQIKVALKTTSSLTPFTSNATDCVEICFRGPASKRLAGFIFGHTDGTSICGEGVCGCNSWLGTADLATKLVLWDYDQKNAFQPTGVELRKLNRIFSRALDTSMVEIAFDMPFEMAIDDVTAKGVMSFAGFGYAGKRNGQWTIKNLAGFCAGTIPSGCLACKEFTCGECTGLAAGSSKVWSICASENAAPDTKTTTTAAYGKWTIDWSSTIYNRVSALQTLTPGAGWEDIGAYVKDEGYTKAVDFVQSELWDDEAVVAD